MCVIALKPAGTSIKYKDLSDQWDCNPDGAGLAYWDKGKIVIDKGHMQKDTFFAALCGLEDREVVYHLRLATHGLTNRHQTHPFVVDRKVARCKGLRPIKAKECVFHNGVLTGLGDDSISDTIDLVSSVLADLSSPESRLKALQAVPGKYAYFADGEIYLIGGFQTVGECKYSNLNWRFGGYTGSRWTRTKYGGWVKDMDDLYYDYEDQAPTLQVIDPLDAGSDCADLDDDSFEDCLLDSRDFAHVISKKGGDHE